MVILGGFALENAGEHASVDLLPLLHTGLAVVDHHFHHIWQDALDQPLSDRLDRNHP